MSIKTICLILLIAMMTSGCAGAADWDLPLTGGYTISRVNSREIILSHDEAPEGSSSIVIPCFFVTDFCYNQKYIGVCGIPTSGYIATELELKSEERVFYLVEVSSDTVYGPYPDKNDYIAQCEKVSTGDMGEWYSTKELDYYL